METNKMNSKEINNAVNSAISESIKKDENSKALTVPETQEFRKLKAIERIKNSPNLSGLNHSQIVDVLEVGIGSAMKSALPKALSPDRMIQILATVIHKNPLLAKCTTLSLLGASLQAVNLGFQPIPELGLCYFVPFWNSKINGYECQFIIGYKGYHQLARRSNEVLMVTSECVYKGDEFEYSLGLNPDLKHVPNPDNDRIDASQITHAYAIAKYKDGGFNFVVLSKNQVEKYRKLSSSQKVNKQVSNMPVGIWSEHYESMAKKTAMRRLAHYLPLSVEQIESMSTDEKIIQKNDFVISNNELSLQYEKLEPVEYEDLNNVNKETGEVKEVDNFEAIFGKED